jgi:SAM-dependent methyltransferase
MIRRRNPFGDDHSAERAALALAGLLNLPVDDVSEFVPPRRSLGMSTLAANDEEVRWRALLTECQEEVALLATNPHYRAAYREQELSYWLNVPGWIQADTCERRPQRCLDIGCAYGTLMLFTKKLTGCEAFGMDFTDAYISPALVKKYDITFAVSNIELDPLPWPHLYDLVLFTEVLEHLNFRAERTLCKIAECLAPGGVLYLTTPDAAEWGRTTRYYTSYAELPEPRSELRSQLLDDHVWQFDEAEVRNILEKAGLTIVRFAFAPGQSRRHFNLTLRRIGDQTKADPQLNRVGAAGRLPRNSWKLRRRSPA